LDFSRPQKVLIALGLLGVLGGITLLSLNRLARPQAAAVTYTPPADSSLRPSGRVAVHVVGEVRRPGIYWLAAGARVADAVQAAGGPTSYASAQSVNLAATVQDGSQVVVGRVAATGESWGASATPRQATAPPSQPAPQPAASVPVSRPVTPVPQAAAQPAIVSLNAATPAQLETLPGIGQELARRILYYRYEHGGFHSVDQLAEVEGIGPQRLQQLRPYVRP
jgi:competence protein ComEA